MGTVTLALPHPLAGQPKVVCCRCHRVLREGDPSRPYLISHGYCPKCEADVRAEWGLPPRVEVEP